MAVMEDEVAIENEDLRARFLWLETKAFLRDFSIRGGTRALRLLSELAESTPTVMRREAKNTAYPFLTTYSQEV